MPRFQSAAVFALTCWPHLAAGQSSEAAGAATNCNDYQNAHLNVCLALPPGPQEVTNFVPNLVPAPAALAASVVASGTAGTDGTTSTTATVSTTD